MAKPSVNIFQKVILKRDPELIIIDDDDDDDDDNNDHNNINLFDFKKKFENPYIRPILSNGAFEIATNNTSVYLTNLDRLSATDPNYNAAISNYNQDYIIHNNSSNLLENIKQDNEDVIEISDSDDEQTNSSKLLIPPVMDCEDLLSDSEDDGDVEKNIQQRLNRPYNQTNDNNFSDSDMDIEPPLENTIQTLPHNHNSNILLDNDDDAYLIYEHNETNTNVKSNSEFDSKTGIHSINSDVSKQEPINTKYNPYMVYIEPTNNFDTKYIPMKIEINHEFMTKQEINTDQTISNINDDHRFIENVPPIFQEQTETNHEIKDTSNSAKYTQSFNEEDDKPLIFLKKDSNSISKPYCCRPFRCSLCPLSFTRKCKLDYHIRQHETSENDEEDDNRTENVQSTKNLIAEKTVASDNNIETPINAIETIENNVENKRFSRHMTTDHKIKISEKNPIIDDKNAVECTICFRKFRLAQSLRRHITMEHSKLKASNIKKPVTCTICSKTYVNLKILRIHTTKYHKTKDELKEVNERKCSICSRIFKSRIVLDIHMRHAHNRRQLNSTIIAHYCRVCVKFFFFFYV